MKTKCAVTAFISAIVIFILLLINEPCLDIVIYIATCMLGVGIGGVLIGKGY